MFASIDDHRAEYGVQPSCRVLPSTPSTYHEHKACEAGPTLCSTRTRRDEDLRKEIHRVWMDNRQVYGCGKFGVSSFGRSSLYHGTVTRPVREMERSARSATVAAGPWYPRTWRISRKI